MFDLKEQIKNIWYKMPPNIKYRVYTLKKSRPMEEVLTRLQSNNINLRELNALEVFGKTGEWHTLDYGYKVKSLEVWEIDSSCKASLKRNFPFATVKIVDSYMEVERCNKKYSLIVIDNPMSTYGDYCEHFSLFPKMVTLCDENAIIIINVIPKINEDTKAEYPYLFNDIQLEKRRQFYKTNCPDKLTFEEIDSAYKNMALKEHFKTEWSFFHKRNFVYYYVFKLKKI
ncbi:hypothetical protein [Desulfosporosinus sp. OT]|uniref:hypothetical protein n=1 Tax=Desulfosporosinus sp. OT TaxID=913865 RepID=UPI0002239D95|nr:hypothetical protein [Desulfosporosinus sp. OT]EGW36602.1 hypothetical protein DOT_5467 [Desulfosporosinus sp. OT]